MNKGFDANKDLSPFSNCLLNAGYNFVGRYYNINNPAKNLTFAEANFLSSIGIGIVAVWENGFPTSSAYFSEAKGINDGTAAYQYAALTIDQPALTPIYFAVDYDASVTDVNGVIIQYFNGIVTGFNRASNNNPKYFIGIYGSGLVCKTIKGSGIASHSWLAQSMGWQGSKTYTDYNIKQLKEKSECIDLSSITGDPNESPNENEGSFKVAHSISLLSKKVH